MPNYGDLPSGVGSTGQPATALEPGCSRALFNAEAPAAGQASIAIAPTMSPTGAYSPMVFDIQFSAAPTDSLVIQGASVDVDGSYQTLYTSTNKQQDYYADQGSFKFYRAKLVSISAGTPVTVTASRA